MMKLIAVSVAAFAACCLDCRADEAAEVAEVAEVMQDALLKMEDAAKVRVEEKAVVHAVFNEGTNSSFITRTELTATQKRFLEMGRRMVQMALYIQSLETRLASLEAIENERLERRERAASISRERLASDKRKRDDRLKRAVERARSGQSSKRNRSINDAGR